MGIKKVWVEPGCIVCLACEQACPKVFKVTHDNSEIIPNADLKANEELIKEAARACPVEVIKIEEE